jgi:glycosyltransferase involved in cell wall biosynthesis
MSDTDSSLPLVSFVIATYGRPDALYTTLTALTCQTLARWEAIVVGDCCGDQTEAVIRSVNDPRISYYNLPERFGEQAGPNTFGMQLVRGHYLCFLNHDDLLLPDHLACAIEAMDRHDADFYFGRFGSAVELCENQGQVRPVFSKLVPEHQDKALMYHPQCEDLDPSSFWLVRTTLAKAVGPWRLARDLWRNPISDWLLRAWKASNKVVFGRTMTGLRIHTHNAVQRQQTNRPVYQIAAPEYSYLHDLLTSNEAPRIREIVMADIHAHERLRRYTYKAFRIGVRTRFRGLRARVALLLYLLWGFDFYTWRCQRKGLQRGAHIDKLSVYRTGTALGSADGASLMSTPADVFRKI